MHCTEATVSLISHHRFLHRVPEWLQCVRLHQLLRAASDLWVDPAACLVLLHNTIAA